MNPIERDRLKFEKESFNKNHQLELEKFKFTKQSQKIQKVAVFVTIIGTIVTLIFQVPEFLSQESKKDRKNQILLQKAAFEQEVKNEFRDFVIENEQLFFNLDTTNFSDSLRQMKLLIESTFPNEVINVDSFFLKMATLVPEEKRSAVQKVLLDCNPFPNGVISSRQKTYVNNKTLAVWKVVVASLPSCERAEEELNTLKALHLERKLPFKIFKATDRTLETTWALTIGHDLTFDEAKNLVCEARTQLNFRTDTYMWVNTNWQAYDSCP